jgi:CRISPR/Cas system-associated exonuclease Cas4 (RecB family)
MIPQINQLTDFYFNELYKDGEISYGINLLTVKMSKIYIRNLLNNDILYLKQLSSENKFQTIRMLEKKMETIIDLSNADIPLIKLKGFVDRVDSENGKVRIVDYKTGKVEERNLKIINFEQLISESKYSKCFQLAVYAFLFANENPEYDQEIKTGILSLRNISKGFLNFNYNESDVLLRNDLADFEQILKDILMEIYDKSSSFVQTEIEENCRYCLYKDICGK